MTYLSQWFDVLEINTSFYGPPKDTTTRAWVEDVAASPAFRFTAKLWRGFTHERNATAEDERLFNVGMMPLLEAGRLGAVLMQFPISFHNTPDNRQYLLGLHSRFAQYPLVVEVRHESWGEESTLEMLAALEIGFCNIDQPALGRSLRPSAEATSPVAYVRLHGRNYQQWFTHNERSSDRYNYLYSHRELEPWADRILAISGKRREGIFVVTNNHFEGKAVVNALQLSALLKSPPSQPLPEHLMQRYPELRQMTAS